MKAKGWMTIALALAVAGSGTGMLARAMAGEQDTEVTTGSPVNGEAVSQQESAELQKAQEMADESAEFQKAVEEYSYKIEMREEVPKEKNPVKKTKADLTAAKAVEFAIEKIEETFGPVTIQKVTGVGLVGRDDTSNANMGYESGCRAYSGLVLCKGKVGYVFLVNSITGQVISIEKVTDYIDPGLNDPDAYDRYQTNFEQNKDTFKKAAKTFAAQNLKAGDVVKCKLAAGSSAGEEYYDLFNWERFLVEAQCKTAEGAQYRIKMDINTYEVLEWDLLSLPE